MHRLGLVGVLSEKEADREAVSGHAFSVWTEKQKRQ